jgi:hypothetical protein
MGECCSPRPPELTFAAAPANWCLFAGQPKCLDFLGPDTCHFARPLQAVTRRRRPPGLEPRTFEVDRAEHVRLVFVTVASVSTQDSNPLVWIANGVGSATSTAWNILVERSLSIWRPGADEDGDSFGEPVSDGSKDKGLSPRHAPSPADEEDWTAATPFCELFDSQGFEGDDDGLAARLMARRSESHTESIGGDRRQGSTSESYSASAEAKGRALRDGTRT